MTNNFFQKFTKSMRKNNQIQNKGEIIIYQILKYESKNLPKK